MLTTFIHVAGTRYEIERGLIQATAIYNLCGANPASHYLLLEIQGDRDIPLTPTDYIIVSGRERFSIGDAPYPAHDNPSLRVPVRPTFNDERLPEHAGLKHAKVTTAELAALDPNFDAGDGIFVDLDDLPDEQLREGWRLVVQNDDQFYTSPCGNVGYDNRLSLDVNQARRLFGTVDLVSEGGRSLVIFRDQPLPAHWNRPSTDVLFQVPQGYPLGALDMFWVRPGLRLQAGTMPEAGDVHEVFASESWQRFSWHYPPNVPWNPAVDGILSHMRFARTRLAQVR